MTLEQLVGQHIIIGLAGLTLSAEEKAFITANNIGGVILFARNVKSPTQVLDLCKEIQGLRTKTAGQSPFFISIDMEGGRVARMKEPLTVWPPLKYLGDLDSPAASFQFAFSMGHELRACGINLDYAPVLDVFTNPKNTVIGDRSISSDPEMVAKHASALVRGYLKAGIIPCGKHFPGHGNTIIDSHLDLPVEEANLDRLNEVELIPFKKSFKAGLDLVMTAHILFPKIDPDWPATLSEKFVKNILKDELRYRGLVMTDDLDMKAMAAHYDRRMIPVRALQAGCDLLLYCNEPESPPRAIEACVHAIQDGWLSKDQLEDSYNHIQRFKAEYLDEKQLVPGADMQKYIGCAEHQELAKGIREGKVNLPS